MTARGWHKYQTALPSLLEAIGRTPLVRLNRVTAGLSAEIYGKIEWYSPTGSLKDRAYARMIEEAERRGVLRPGMTILECSTGNAGAACAFVAALRGYPCIIVMPAGMSVERQKLIRAYGADLVLTPGGESDVDLSLVRLEEIRTADVERYWVPSQFDNPDNIRAHYATTGPEIWEQMDGRIDAFVASQGTGGTLTGVGRYLRERNPRVALFAVEPAECPFLSKREWGPHGIEGIGDGLVPRNLDLSLLTGIITTSTEESVAIAKRLGREEALFCGISSGCNVAAALKLCLRHPEFRRVVVMINDTGQRYFSTALCDAPKEWEVPEREHPIDAYSRAELDTYQPRWEIIT